MKRFAFTIALVLFACVLAGGAYGLKGYLDARAAGPELAKRADRLIADGRGPAALGKERLRQLLAVQDPQFFEHDGVDLWTAGAGLTTVTQSLAKRLGFENFHPGIGKIRQTGYAIGLEQELSKPQILALFLETVEMGRGPGEQWITGFFEASDILYRQAPAALGDDEFLSLVAVMIAPGRFTLTRRDEDLQERKRRISRLVADRCQPDSQGDVWLNGCAVP